MGSARDWVIELLDQRMERDSDGTPWAPDDLRIFAEQNEIDPRNDKELFAIALKRLKVLKLDVERSENSKRDELRRGDDEMHLRRWVQRNLIERSLKRYTIPQEAEIDLQERPDLRLENPKTGPVSIEIKWADRWTVPQLLEGLETQLVGQYLRAHNSQCGVYLLGFIGEKEHWQDPDTGQKLDFPGVVKIINEKALDILKTNVKVARLEVISINFCEPS